MYYSLALNRPTQIFFFLRHFLFVKFFKFFPHKFPKMMNYIISMNLQDTESLAELWTVQELWTVLVVSVLEV